MVYLLKSPFALYRAFRAANVPDNLAREAAFAVSADLEAVLAQGLAGQTPPRDPKMEETKDTLSPR